MKFHEILPGENRTFQVDGHTDSTRPIIAFRSCFAKTPKYLQDNNEEWISKKLKWEELRCMRDFLSLDRRTDNVVAQS